MTTPTYLPVPQSLLAIDLRALGEPAAEGWHRLGDRLAGVRLGTVLVYIGGAGFGGLPDPDYLVDLDAEVITRLPEGEEVDGWPRSGEPADIAGAVLHLSEAIMVSSSEVYLVLGPDRPVP
ncbi:MAG: hypothetical protein OEX97_13975, partial [Acidimicrobiia bacterium]|nr:hypothetical protein [Acidimicrobiia bacterium]